MTSTPQEREWAAREFLTRDREIGACRSYLDYCRMKRKWDFRRKDFGLTRDQAKKLIHEYVVYVGADA
jgi:hypothetical protein